MANDDFLTNLLRACLAHIHFQSALLAAREMFGKSYFSLGLAEKLSVDQAVIGNVAGNYQQMTLGALASQAAPREAGFLDRGAKQSEEKSKD